MSITASQIRLIHTAKRSLCMDEDTYRAMLRNVAKVSSSAELTSRKFEAVLAHLQEVGFVRKPAGYWKAKQKWDALGHRPGMATAAQLARIETEWGNIRFYWEPKGFPTERAALKAFMKKIVNADDLRFLNEEKTVQILTVIEKIKRARRNDNGTASPSQT